MDVQPEMSITHVTGAGAATARNRESPWGTWLDCDGLIPPPFGGPPPSFITNSYDDDIWVGHTINPAVGRPVKINFGAIPAPFRWYAKWFLWGLEFLPAHLTRGGEIRSSRSAAYALSNI